MNVQSGLWRLKLCLSEHKDKGAVRVLLANEMTQPPCAHPSLKRAHPTSDRVGTIQPTLAIVLFDTASDQEVFILIKVVPPRCPFCILFFDGISSISRCLDTASLPGLP